MSDTWIAVAVAVCVALVQALVFWLILGDFQALVDAMLLTFAALSIGNAGEAVRLARNTDESDWVTFVTWGMVVFFGAVAVCLAKATDSSDPEWWNLAAFLVVAILTFGGWSLRFATQRARL